MRGTVLKDWSIATAASLVLYMTGFVSPRLTLPAMLVYSLPTVFLAFGGGFFCSLSSASLVSISIGLTASGVYGLTCFFMFGLPGALMGHMARIGGKGGGLLVASSSVEFAGKLAGILILYVFFGLNLLAPGAEEIERYLNYFGVPVADPVMTREIVNRVVLMIPYSMIFFSTVEALTCLLLASAIHKKRTGEAFFILPPFNEWVFPKNVLFPLVVGFICARLTNNRENLYLLRLMGANLSELSRTILIVQGLSCACFLMERRGVPKPLRIAAIIFTPFISLLGDILAIVGVTDMGFGIRDRIRRA
ncbi:MAG: YybS family protein [Synergistaceae bacterium]|jgi:hypothetical protein|nr:YybS family protein [Synergistaceae bacterium]